MMHALFASSHFLFLCLLRVSLEASVLIGLMLLAQRLCRNQLTPRWRHALWLLVAIRLVLPSSLPSSFSLFNLWPSNLPLLSTGGSAVAETQIESPDFLSPIASGAEGQATAAASGLASLTAPRPYPTWAGWLAGVWLIGAVSLGIGLLVTCWQMRRRIRRERALTTPGVLDLLEDCKQEMKVYTPLVVFETAAVASPSLYGFIRPRLLLPTGLTRSFVREELRHVFRHELAHIKRHDILVNWLTTLLLILHWFNPLVWYAFSRMQADRELACDALALSLSSERERQAYGDTIIKLLEQFSGPVRLPSMAGILEDRDQMKTRIRMITQFKKTNGWPVTAAVLVFGLALVGLTDAQVGNNSPAPNPNHSRGARAVQSNKATSDWDLQEEVRKAESGNSWAAFALWDAYYRGKHGIQPDSAQADKWLGQLAQDVWVVRFEPTDDFAPTNPQEFLARIHQYASCQSGRTNFGVASFFRTTQQGDKLIGSFLSNYPDQLKASLAQVPGLKATSVERLTPEHFVKYEASQQETLWSLQQKVKQAEAGNKWAVYELWGAYDRGNHGVQPDSAQAKKWLTEFVQNVWVVRFEPVDGFAPTSPAEFLARINHHASAYSGLTDIGKASFFRTTKQDDKLIGSFLSNDPDQLKASLAKVPGLKVTSIEKITPSEFIKYEQLPQESL